MLRRKFSLRGAFILRGRRRFAEQAALATGPFGKWRCRRRLPRMSGLASPLCCTARGGGTLEGGSDKKANVAMHISVSHRSTSRGIWFAYAAFSAAEPLPAASDVANAHPAGHYWSTVSGAEPQLVRRCELGSKQEHCYWVKSGVQSAARRWKATSFLAAKTRVNDLSYTLQKCH